MTSPDYKINVKVVSRYIGMGHDTYREPPYRYCIDISPYRLIPSVNSIITVSFFCLVKTNISVDSNKMVFQLPFTTLTYHNFWHYRDRWEFWWRSDGKGNVRQAGLVQCRQAGVSGMQGTSLPRGYVLLHQDWDQGKNMSFYIPHHFMHIDLPFHSSQSFLLSVDQVHLRLIEFDSFMCPSYVCYDLVPV